MITKAIQTYLKLFFLFGFMFVSCDDQDDEIDRLNDLFPLKVGNEFYYRYDKTKYGIITEYTVGKCHWVVIDKSFNKEVISYTLKRTLNAMVTIPIMGDTTYISNQITFSMITEDKSTSMITFWGLQFKRFQDTTIVEIIQSGGTQMPSQEAVFKADSGMVYYTYYHPPNQVVHEHYFLDSVKLLH